MSEEPERRSSVTDYVEHQLGKRGSCQRRNPTAEKPSAPASPAADQEDAPRAQGRASTWLGSTLFLLGIILFLGEFSQGYPRLGGTPNVGGWLRLNVFSLPACLLAFYAGILRKNGAGRLLLVCSGLLLAASTVLFLRPADPQSAPAHTTPNDVSQPPSHESTVTSSLPPRDSRFTLITLPLGVRIEVPKNWHLIGDDLNTTIEAAGEAATKLAGIAMPRGQKVNLFRANSNPPTTYAGIAINASDSEMSPADVMAASDAEIAELGSVMRQMFEQAFAKQNWQLIRFDPVRREMVDGHPSLVIEYVRSGPRGAVVVQMTRLLIGDKEISLNLSYRQSETGLWKPIVAYMRSTFRVSPLSPTD